MRPLVMRLPRGSLLGRYVVLDVLGSRGMGDVYTAFDLSLSAAMARLAHPNVVSIYDVGSSPGRCFWRGSWCMSAP